MHAHEIIWITQWTHFSVRRVAHHLNFLFMFGCWKSFKKSLRCLNSKRVLFVIISLLGVPPFSAARRLRFHQREDNKRNELYVYTRSVEYENQYDGNQRNLIKYLTNWIIYLFSGTYWNWKKLVIYDWTLFRYLNFESSSSKYNKWILDWNERLNEV